MISATPVVMIVAGVIFLLAAVKVLIQQRRIIEVVPYSNASIQLPSKWDDTEITRLLQRHHDQPAVLAHAVTSIKQRMIVNQDIKTAQQRLKLVASVIEVFKLNRELQGILHDLHLAETEVEIRKLEGQIRLEDAQARQKSEQRLRSLRQQRDEMQLNKEIAQLTHDTDAIRGPARTSQQPSPEQQRASEKASCEARIQTLKDEKQKALKITDEAERVLKTNALDDALQREYERWARLV
jgi:hypothetical protein